MTFASVSTALADIAAAVPGVAHVAPGEQTKLGPRGSLTPDAGQTPLVRITAGPEREVPLSHDQDYDRTTPYTVELYDYAENPATAAAAFADLKEALRRAIRRSVTLDGAADTDKTTVLNAAISGRPVGGSGPRPMSRQPGQSLLHDRFIVQVREWVRF